MSDPEKQEMPDYVRRHLEGRGIDIASLTPEVHNALATTSKEEVNTLDSVRGRLDDARADDSVKSGTV
jgi:hypothetical protein